MKDDVEDVSLYRMIMLNKNLKEKCGDEKFCLGKKILMISHLRSCIWIVCEGSTI